MCDEEGGEEQDPCAELIEWCIKGFLQNGSVRNFNTTLVLSGHIGGESLVGIGGGTE